MMLSEKAYAKLNLVLDVVGKRLDGYHDLKSIMIPLELHDELIFEKSENLVIVSNVDIPNNIVEKAARLLIKKYDISSGVKIIIEKNIPIGGGLAGGSADASAALRGLNKFFNINVSMRELEDLALELGSDTLFCLYNKPAYVFGRGEHMEFLESLELGSITLICPKTSCSTTKIFSNFKKSVSNDFDKALRLYKNKEKELFIKSCYNDLLNTVLSINSEFKNVYDYYSHLLDDLKMTGSGSTMFSFSGHENIKKHNYVKIIKTKAKN